MDAPSKKSLDSRKTTTLTTFPMSAKDLQEDIFSDSSMTIEGQSMKCVQNVRPDFESTLSPLISQATMDEMYVSFNNYSVPTSVYDDLMARLCNDNDILQLGRENTFNEQIPLDDISLEVLKAVEGLTNDTNSTTLLTSNSLEEVNISIPPAARVVVSEAFTPFQSPSFPMHHPYGYASAGANPSVGVSALVAASASANASVGGIACASVNTNASVSTTIRLATIDPQDPPQIGTSFGNIVFPNTMGNPLTQFQSYSSSTSFPMLPYDSSSSSSSSYQQSPRYPPFLMTGIGPQGIPATMPQFNQGNSWLRPPPLTDFPNFVHAWEGSLIGRIHSYRQFRSKAMVVRKPTSLVMLTSQWKPMLEIVLFLPTNAVNYTMQICGGPIDYVFFHITHFNNINLYDHLISKNMCAKIDLPSQSVILSMTSSKYHFLGAVFPRETIFVEPV